MYFVLVLWFSALGALSFTRRRDAVMLFVVSVLALPNSTAYDAWDYRSGVYAYDFFFLVPLGTFALQVLVGRLRRDEFVDWLFCIGVLAVAVTIAVVMGRGLDKYWLRDLRPYLLLFECLLVAHLARGEPGIPSAASALLTSTVAVVGASIGFGFLMFGIVTPPDQFYDENRFRYFGVASYFCLFMLTWLVSGGGPWPARVRFYASAACVVVIVLAGVRMLVVGLIVGGAFGMRTDLRALSRYIALSVVGAVTFLWVSYVLEVERVTDALSLVGIAVQLAVRFGPAIAAIDDMTGFERVFGLGLGSTFEIPWFEFRGLDVLNSFVDSTFITMYVKLGVLSVIYYWAGIRALQVRWFPLRERRALLATLAVLGLTMAIPYQKVALGLVLFLLFVRAAGNERRIVLSS